MPSLIDFRRRIRSVTNTQQITKAMKMVSAAKLRHAQDRALASRPYAEMMARVLSELAAAAGSTEDPGDLPLLQVREEKRIQLIVVTSDRGLAGAFNANLLRAAQRFMDDHPNADIRVESIGRKARDYFLKRHVPMTGEHVGIIEKPSYQDAVVIADQMIALYSKEETDAVYIIVNEFKNVMSPNLVIRRILPIAMPEGGGQINYICEQPPGELLRTLLPRYVQLSIYRAMLESVSAEHAARMTAMDAATQNAAEVAEHLTLNLNRARQGAITTELIEIVSGAAALS
ncbi:MAG: ATP synthase F1 subunit gamma [Acidobacteriaceae bacterium]|nr:ATP synthase F1 subunit gamma [Acidobacteriaceae bacterium]